MTTLGFNGVIYGNEFLNYVITYMFTLAPGVLLNWMTRGSDTNVFTQGGTAVKNAT